MSIRLFTNGCRMHAPLPVISVSLCAQERSGMNGWLGILGASCAPSGHMAHMAF